MDLKKTNLLKKAYKIFMAIYSAIFVAAFIAILCVIYYTGPIASEGSDRTYTFDSKIVTEMLGYLLVPFILLIVFIIAGLFSKVLSSVFDKAVTYKLENDLTI